MILPVCNNITAEELIRQIAEDHPETGRYKLEWQRDVFQRACQFWLKNHEEFKNDRG